MQKHPGKKFASLQILRALAAWAVVYHHYMQLYFAFSASSALGAAFSRYGDIGVDIFFVLSGFVMYFAAADMQHGARPFMIDRIFRVVPVYWVYTAAMITCVALMPAAFSYTGTSVKTVAASLLFLPHTNVSGLGAYPVLTVGWTLNFEMFFYATLAISLALTRRYFWAVLCLTFICLPLLYPARTFYSDIAASFLLYEFLAGFTLALLLRSRSFSLLLARHARMSLLLAAAATAAASVLLVTRNARFPFAVSIVLIALMAERYINAEAPWVKALVRLGNESYSTYLVHVIVISIVLQFTGNTLTESGQLLTLLAITAGIWLISRLSYRYIEQNRYLAGLRLKMGGAKQCGPASRQTGTENQLAETRSRGG